MIKVWLKSHLLYILGILFAVLVTGAYLKGRMDCSQSLATEQVESIQETQKNTNETRRVEQSKTSDEIDRALCDLKIVRERAGCE